MDYEALFAACNRIRAGDSAAFDDLHTLTAGELFVRIKPAFPDTERSIIYDAVTDILLKFLKDPSCCRATTGAQAFAFFRASVRNKVLNALRDSQCRFKYEAEAVADAGDVALVFREVSDIEEGEAEVQARVADLEHRLPNPRDRELFRLLLSGERDTAVFARVLGVDHLSVAEQNQEVKRAKDRIMKFLQRKVREA